MTISIKHEQSVKHRIRKNVSTQIPNVLYSQVAVSFGKNHLDQPLLRVRIPLYTDTLYLKIGFYVSNIEAVLQEIRQEIDIKKLLGEF